MISRPRDAAANVYGHAFHSAPVPALLFDGYRLASVNEAAQRLLDGSEISTSFLRELQAFTSRHRFEVEPGTIDGATMRFRVLLPRPSEADEHLRIRYLVPTRREPRAISGNHPQARFEGAPKMRGLQPFRLRGVGAERFSV